MASEAATALCRCAVSKFHRGRTTYAPFRASYSKRPQGGDCQHSPTINSLLLHELSHRRQRRHVPRVPADGD